jgi:hypothetical protein
MGLVGVAMAAVPWIGLIAAFVYGFIKRREQRVRKGQLTLRNVGMVWIWRMVFLAVLITAAGQLVFLAGGCEGGFSTPLECSLFDEGFVEIFMIAVVGLVFFALPFLGLAMLLLFILMMLSPPLASSGEGTTPNDHAT